MPPPLEPLPASLEGLPKQFVQSLRTLFDILDDQGTGFVRFTDIEKRWNEHGAKDLPKGVIESLRKVTPPNGLLSFERFCTGLKICLLKNQMEHQNKSGTGKQVNQNDGSQPFRPPSAPILDTDKKPKWNVPSTVATVRPTQQRTTSMPHLPADCKEQYDPNVNVPKQPVLYGPPKPPRTGACYNYEKGIDKAGIRAVLQNWQMNILMNENAERKVAAQPTLPPHATRYSGDGNDVAFTASENCDPLHKKISRKKEPRRHTLQNGIDYNMLKKIKQVELEKSVLVEGLQAVERARDWYIKRIAIVQEKMNSIGKIGSHAEWSEAQQERIELQRARILEVNRHLASLVGSSEKGGLPLHMNLAVHSLQPPNLLTQLKQQNHLLTKEVNQKSEKISVLERENSSLLRELYQARRRSNQPHDEKNTAYI